MVSAPILIVGGIIMALRTDVPLSGLLRRRAAADGRSSSALVMSRAIPLFRATQVKLDRINQVMRETLAGVRVIRAFVRTRHEERGSTTASRDLFDTALRVSRLFALTIPVMTAIFNLSTVAVIWFGAIRVDDGALSIGNLTAFLQYLQPDPVRGPDRGVHVHPRSRARRCRRAGSARSSTPSRRSTTRERRVVPDATGPSAASVEFRDVEFRYPGAEEPGAARHLVPRRARARRRRSSAAPAAARRRSINLIPRFYDATGGAVLVDGVDVRDDGPRGPLGADRHHPPEGVPVRRDRGEQPPLRRRRRHRRRAVARARASPRAATSSRRWRAASRRRSPRAARTSRAASASASRSPGRSSRRAAIYVFDDSFSALDFATDARLRAALERELGRRDA